MSGYKPQAMKDYEDSPEYAVKHWRNVPEQENESLDNFLFWLEYDCEDFPEEKLQGVKTLVNQYLGRDMHKVKQGEKILLEKWTLSTKG